MIKNRAGMVEMRLENIHPGPVVLFGSGETSPSGRKVFDLVLPLDQVAEGYRAMDERRAIKTLLRP